MGLQSFGWADGPWRMAPGGRPLADGLGGAAVRHSTDGRSWQPVDEAAVCHAVRRVEWRTSVGLSDASGRPADADMDVRTHDNPKENMCKRFHKS
jgi:hypothetical protein